MTCKRRKSHDNAKSQLSNCCSFISCFHSFGIYKAIEWPVFFPAISSSHWRCMVRAHHNQHCPALSCTSLPSGWWGQHYDGGAGDHDVYDRLFSKLYASKTLVSQKCPIHGATCMQIQLWASKLPWNTSWWIDVMFLYVGHLVFREDPASQTRIEACNALLVRNKSCYNTMLTWVYAL